MFFMYLIFKDLQNLLVLCHVLCLKALKQVWTGRGLAVTTVRLLLSQQLVNSRLFVCSMNTNTVWPTRAGEIRADVRAQFEELMLWAQSCSSALRRFEDLAESALCLLDNFIPADCSVTRWYVKVLSRTKQNFINYIIISDYKHLPELPSPTC